MARVFEVKGKKGTVFYLDYFLGGKRVRERFGKSKTKAQLALSQRLADIQAGLFNLPPSKRVVFRDFAKEYVEHKRIHGRRAIDRIENSLMRLGEFFGNHYLRQITPVSIEKYKESRLEKVKGPTVNRELAALKNMFTVASKLGKYRGQNPVKGVEFFKENRRDAHILSHEEIEKLKAASPEYLRPVIMVALNTGMRKNELLNLRWENVDFDNDLICLPQTKSARNLKIPMNSTVRNILLSLKERNGQGKHVFTNPATGRRLRRIDHAFAAARKEVGLPEFWFHDLRHNALTLMAEAGASAAVLKEIAGHASITTTERYFHPQDEAKRRAVDLLTAVFQPHMEPDQKAAKDEAQEIESPLTTIH